MIIGIFGEAGVGKSTVAKMITDRNFGLYPIVSFADEIKRTAARWFGYTPNQLWGSSENRNQPPPGRPDLPTARKTCQFLGTEVGRSLYPNLWPEYAIEIANALEVGMPRASGSRYVYVPHEGLTVHPGWDPPPRGVIIADGRFPNETSAIARAGGITVRIHRPGYEPKPGAHTSETSLSSIPDDAFNDVINNDKDLAALYDKVDRLIEQFGL